MRICLCVLISPFLLFPGLAMAGHHLADSSDQGEVDVFDLNRIWTIHLRVTADGWQKMQPIRATPLAPILAAWNLPPTRSPATQTAVPPRHRATQEGERLAANAFGYEYAYVKSTVEIEGETYRDVGLRFKGNSSYNAALTTYKKPYKLDFNRFVDGQKLHGIGTLNLNNNAYDPSNLRETMSYILMREAGIPSPRTGFAFIYLTIEGKCEKEFLGLYTIIEEVDKTFLKDHFKSAKGLMLKPERIRALAYLGENWASYVERYRPKTDGTEATQRRMIGFLDLINNADDETFVSLIASYLNVDEFLRYVAVESLMGNLDSVLTTGHNYYLYINPHDGRAWWMPWDMNLSFGTFTSTGSPQQTVALSISHPWADPNRLLDRLMAIDIYQRAFMEHVRELATTVFAPAKVQAQIDSFAPILARAEKVGTVAAKPGSPATRPASGWGGRIVPDIRQAAAARIASVLAQLDGKDDGYEPAFRRGGFFGASAHGAGSPPTSPTLPPRSSAPPTRMATARSRWPDSPTASARSVSRFPRSKTDCSVRRPLPARCPPRCPRRRQPRRPCRSGAECSSVPRRPRRISPRRW